ncbi:MAG TPA: DUF3794 domain-containing protein [Firmicutes bacterium]|nr:DUF3794 domain-containing protein [Bacillota bacterium]
MAVGLELKQELLKVEQVVGETTVRKVFREMIKIPTGAPTAEKVVSVDATLKTSAYEIIKDKVIIEGKVDVRALYVGITAAGSQPVQLLEQEVSYELVAEIPGTQPGMNVQIDVRAEHVANELVDPHTIRVEVLVRAFAKVTKTEQLEVVTDVKGPEDLKVTKELLKVEDVVGEQASQVVVTERVAVPEEKPDIQSVISVEGRTRLTDVQILDDQVVVEGAVDVNVMYAAAVGDTSGVTRLPVHFMEAKLRFTHVVEVPGARSGMHVQVTVEQETIDYDLIDARTISIDAVVKITVKVTATKQMEVVTDVTSKTVVVDVEKRLLKVQDVVGEDTAQVMLKESLQVPREKPNIDRIIRIDESVKVEETRIIAGKAIVEGTIRLQTLYVAQTAEGDQPVHHMDHQVKFTQYVEIPGAEPEMTAEVRALVEHVEFEVIDDRSFQVRLLVSVTVKVTEPVQLNIVIDVVIVTPPEVPCPTPTMTFVTVQPGDTLWSLARKYNTTVEAIVQANKIADPNMIQVGQVLQIPVCPPPKG